MENMKLAKQILSKIIDDGRDNSDNSEIIVQIDAL